MLIKKVYITHIIVVFLILPINSINNQGIVEDFVVCMFIRQKNVFQRAHNFKLRFSLNVFRDESPFVERIETFEITSNMSTAFVKGEQCITFLRIV